MTETRNDPIFDLFVIGGGVNGCGIARDASGRGLTVALAEKGDLAEATSSASTKLFHGGLRYLEYFEIRLVREALIEREVLLRAMPHISHPMRFVLPLSPDMRFDAETPASRLLSVLMPWLRRRRPAWMIRLGLFLYDHLGGREILPGTTTLDLSQDPAGAPLKDKFRRAFEYSDCWVQDSRLVVLAARDAADRGARIMTRTEVVSAERGDDEWTVHLRDTSTGAERTMRARALVNAAGPWVAEVLGQTLHVNSAEKVRLVRGSHIVTRRLFDHDKAYFFQGTDGRIIFAIPYERDFTLIGTTDEAHDDPETVPECSDAERDYLLGFASTYFDRAVTRKDIVWTYSGVRPLYDDGAKSATAATRDYVLSLNETGGAPLLSIFGGKITTHRKLAEAAFARLAPWFPQADGNWTAGAPLPGGDFSVGGDQGLADAILRDFPAVSPDQAHRLVRTYGTDAHVLLERADDLPGPGFGGGILACELDWTISHEWVRTGADFLWRRTRLGLHLSEDQRQEVAAWVDQRAQQIPALQNDPGT